MEIQIMENERGVRNLYFGHPFSRETYTNSVMLRTPVRSWEVDLEEVYSGKIINITPIDAVESLNVEREHRVIRGTKVMFIGDYEKITEMHNDQGVYHDLKTKAMVKINNPDYLDFSVFTSKILNDRLKDVYSLKSITPDLAKKYMDYAVLYDKDKKHSDKLILKPYFASCDGGVMILTEDFVDFDLDLGVDPENGIVDIKFSITENSSHYINQYIEI